MPEIYSIDLLFDSTNGPAKVALSKIEGGCRLIEKNYLFFSLSKGIVIKCYELVPTTVQVIKLVLEFNPV